MMPRFLQPSMIYLETVIDRQAAACNADYAA